MADLIKEVDYLRFYYASDDMGKDKDTCKNMAYEKFANATDGLFMVPFGL